MKVRELPDRPEWRKLRKGLEEMEIEHIRLGCEGNIAVLVGLAHESAVGYCPGFVGTAWPNPRDQYNRKRGFSIAVGRAMAGAQEWIGGDNEALDMHVPEGLTGRELYEAVKEAAIYVAELEKPAARCGNAGTGQEGTTNGDVAECL